MTLDFFVLRVTLKPKAFCIKRPLREHPNKMDVWNVHRHILNIALALGFHASLPVKFWRECILLANYLINRTPSALLKGKTSFEMFQNKLPPYTQIKTFGCLAYSLPKDKSRARSQPCVFIGYPFGKKGDVFLTHKKINFLYPETRFFMRILSLSQKVYILWTLGLLLTSRPTTLGRLSLVPIRWRGQPKTKGGASQPLGLYPLQVTYHLLGLHLLKAAPPQGLTATPSAHMPTLFLDHTTRLPLSPLDCTI